MFRPVPREVHMGAPPTELKKGFKQRHLTMIAMGGVIGAGLFGHASGRVSRLSSRFVTPTRCPPVCSRPPIPPV